MKQQTTYLGAVNGLRAPLASVSAAAALIALALIALVLTLAPAATAAPPTFLLQIPSGDPAPGGEAGKLDNPRSIAGDPESGHIYISDGSNSRVSVFTAWGLFVRAWGWGVADGAEELQTCGPAEPEETPPPGTCQSGSEGSGAGQFSRPNGVEVDAAGDVYVFDRNNLRVQKFSPEGEFLLMFGGEVNKTTGEDVCTAEDLEEGEECGKGTPGEGPGHLAATVGNYIAHSPTAEAILVGDEGRIQVFNPDGTYREEIGFEGELGSLEGKSVNGLDVDGEGNIYFTTTGAEDAVKLGEGGEPLAPGVPGASAFKVEVPQGVAVDVEGNVHVVDDPPNILPETEARVTIYDASGKRLVPSEAEEEAGEFFPYIPVRGPGIPGIGVNHCPGSEEPGNLYVAFFEDGPISQVRAYGPPPLGCSPPPKRPPVIGDQFARSVGVEAARVQAEINPLFFADTGFQVEYGTGKCSEGGCPNTAPAEPAKLTEEVTNSFLRTTPVTLDGLAPNTPYNYRFVAQSEGGGPVLGEEGQFRTFAAPGAPGPCPNEEGRSGAGALLPDCRGYEMVSPLDKEGGDVALFVGRAGRSPLILEVNQSAPSGERFTYSSAFSFADPEAAPFMSQYLAERGPEGWASEGISPPRSESPVPATALFSNETQLFSADLCRSWIRHYSVAPLAEGAVTGYPNAYRRGNCGETPLYRALSTGEPLDREPEEMREMRVHGAAADGERAIFVANGRLTPDAPPLSGERDLLLYEHGPGGLRFVCYLPSEDPSPLPCAAGTAAGKEGGSSSSTRNAISADGSRIFWSAFEGTPGFDNDPGAPGQIYARIEGKETVKVSREVANDPAWYWTAARDGSRAVFEFDDGSGSETPPHADELYEVDVDAAIAGEAEAARLIAGGVEGPLGASEDASVLYFASSEDLDGPEGPGEAGAHNLYRHEAGTGDFDRVAALSAADLAGNTEVPTAVEQVPSQRAARVSADGRFAVFAAFMAPPSGYDNREIESGERAQEVYRYDAAANEGEGELVCVSCNPTGARPSAERFGRPNNPSYLAARIQGWEALGHAPRVISADGSRVFFESIEALVPRDTNATWDVYQWSEAGRGTCTPASPTHNPDTGGCVDLISSGKSDARSVFLDADPSGDNAFFSTQSSLVGADYGLSDVYVARVGGGFPEAPPPAECEGEACQSPDPAPEARTPASSTYRGPGNAAAPARPARCARPARRARALSRRARRLRGAAKRSRAPAARRKRSRAARRSARKARRLSRSAKRCRARRGASKRSKSGSPAPRAKRSHSSGAQREARR